VTGVSAEDGDRAHILYDECWVRLRQAKTQRSVAIAKKRTLPQKVIAGGFLAKSCWRRRMLNIHDLKSAYEKALATHNTTARSNNLLDLHCWRQLIPRSVSIIPSATAQPQMPRFKKKGVFRSVEEGPANCRHSRSSAYASCSRRSALRPVNRPGHALLLSHQAGVCLPTCS